MTATHPIIQRSVIERLHAFVCDATHQIIEVDQLFVASQLMVFSVEVEGGVQVPILTAAFLSEQVEEMQGRNGGALIPLAYRLLMGLVDDVACDVCVHISEAYVVRFSGPDAEQKVQALGPEPNLSAHPQRKRGVVVNMFTLDGSYHSIIELEEGADGRRTCNRPPIPELRDLWHKVLRRAASTKNPFLGGTG